MPINISSIQEVIREARQNARQDLEAVFRLEQEIALKEGLVAWHFSRGEKAEGVTLKEEVKALVIEKAAKFASHKEQLTTVNEKLQELNTADDPRELASLLDDDYPVFLMPVRLEARFMTIKHIARLQVGTTAGVKKVNSLFNGRETLPVIEDHNELWVRIFPDDIFIQSHEEELTELEAIAGQNFWRAMHLARNDEDEKRRDETDEAFETRKEVEVERADLGAWTGLVSGHGKERAAWIAIQTRPNEADTLDEVEELTFRPLTNKTKSWNKAPQTDILPDRFVVKLVSGTSKREVVGNPIAHPLHLSISPREEDATIEAGEKTADSDEEGLLKFPPQLKWLTDFHEAEKVGMALRIPLDDDEASEGFDKVIALGICTSLSPKDGVEELAQLIDNHIYSDGGLSILPQGTPTNNSDIEGSGFSARDRDDEDYHKIALNQPLFVVGEEDMPKTDGEWFKEKLALSSEQAKRIKGATNTDLAQAIAMNQVLWPATFGYFIEQMLFPLVTVKAAGEIRDFFEQNVFGRGHLPALRIDDQPYGMLVCAAFNKWEVDNAETAAEPKKNILDNLLRHVNEAWNKLIEKVPHVKMSGNPDELLVSITSKQASSVEFYQRNAVGRLFLWNLQNLTSSIDNAPPPAGFDEIQNISSIDFFKEFSWLNEQTTIPPSILDLVFTQESQLLNGPLIDSLPSAEVSKLTEIAAEWNYLRWLRESTWYQIFEEDFSNTGAVQAKPPRALLYLLVRHAILLEYQQAGLNYLRNNGQPVPTQTASHEIANLEGLDRSSRLTMLEKSIKQDELLKQNAQITQELVEHVRDFSGSAAELQEEKEFFKKERAQELASAFNQRVEGRIEAADLETELLSIEEIWAKDYGPLTNNQPLSQYVEQLLEDGDPSVAKLSQLKAALGTLENSSTAQLQRSFTEHIDLGSYRLDAWFYALANDRLTSLRHKKQDSPGNYLGAYGWLLDLRPGSMAGIHFEEVRFSRDSTAFKDSPELQINRSESTRENKPEALAKTGAQSLSYKQVRNQVNIQVPDRVADAVDKPVPSATYLGKLINNPQPIDPQYDGINNRFVAPPRVDGENKGFIHAPSLNQATAAAILRAVYEGHKETGGDNAYAVNISSKRVRKAIALLEGIQNGQTLGALLGYQFERSLNDRTRPDFNLNALIYDFRLAFPQVAGSITEADGATKVGEAEAYNVVDGLAILDAYQENPTGSPAWYKEVVIPGDDLKSAVKQVVDELANAVDAIYDLMVAESVFQSAQGNTVRAGAALKMLNGKGAYTDPEIIKTPRNYHLLTHRVGVQFDHQVDGKTVWSDAFGVAPPSPRALAAPQLNHWLSTVFPSPEKINISIVFAEGNRVNFNLAQLGLQPIDFYYLLESTEQGKVSNSFLQYVQWYVKKNKPEASVSSFTVEFDNESSLAADEFNLLSLLPIIEQLKRILGKARALRPEDLVLPSEADSSGDDLTTDSTVVEELKSVMSRFTSSEGEDAAFSLQSLQNRLVGAITNVKALLPADLEAVDLAPIAILQDVIVRSNYFFITPTYPAQTKASDVASIQELIQQGQNLLRKIDKVLSEVEGVKDILNDSEKPPSGEEATVLCAEIAKQVFGKSFKIFPSFKQSSSVPFQTAFSYQKWLDYAGNDTLDLWWRDVAKTNEPIKAWHLLDIYTEAVLDKRICNTRIVQLPLSTDENGEVASRWLGSYYGEDYEVPSENLSLVFKYPDGFQASEYQSGFVLDEWNEEIPLENSTTGLAVNYNTPNTEPPQVCLLAVSPNLTGNWSWDDLMDTLEETISWAKKRGVDPELLDQTPYAQALPTMIAALSGGTDTVSLDLKRNIVQNPVAGNNGLVKLARYEVDPRLIVDRGVVAEAADTDFRDFEALRDDLIKP